MPEMPEMPENGHGSDQPSFEYSQITDQVAIGTNACCTMHFKQELLDNGVTGDISLEGERSDHPDGVATYLWLPTPDHEPPKLDIAEIGIASLEAMLEKGMGVYIHCKNGHGRAPTFFAAYLIKKKGMTAEAAMELIAEKRPSVHFEQSQKDFLATL